MTISCYAWTMWRQNVQLSACAGHMWSTHSGERGGCPWVVTQRRGVFRILFARTQPIGTYPFSRHMKRDPASRTFLDGPLGGGGISRLA